MKDFHKCHYYNLCGEMIPSYLKTCFECKNIFKDWKINKEIVLYPNTMCSICLKSKVCVENFNCSHLICILDFRIKYFHNISEDIIIKKIGIIPKHPYQYILDNSNLEYEDFHEDKYPLIVEYNKLLNEYYIKLDLLKNELFNQQCYLCENILE